MALSFHPLFIGGDPMHVTSIYALVAHLEKTYGVHYAMGGVQAIADAMADVVRAQGGVIKHDTVADEIVVEGGAAKSVRLEGGEEPVPHLGWDNGVDWTKEEPVYRAKVAAEIDKIMPGFQDHISTETVFTPETFRDRYLSPHGCGFSLEPRILQSAWFRPHNVSEEAKGLFLVGAGTHPGAGLPGVVSSAEVLAKLVPDMPVVPAATRLAAE